LKQLDLQPIFNRELAVPNVNTFSELASVLREAQAFESESELTHSLHELQEITGNSERVGLGIKKVLLSVGEAKQDSDNPPLRFAEIMAQQIAASMD
jgi:vesicle-fusing ATPase